MGEIEIIERWTCELGEDLTGAIDTINEALYRGEENSKEIMKLFFSDPNAYNILVKDRLGLGAVSQASLCADSNSVHLRVTGFRKRITGRHLYPKLIARRVDYGRAHDMKYAWGTTMNPYVMNVFVDNGFLLPNKVTEETEQLRTIASDILSKKHGSDLGLTERFVVPAGRLPYPNVRNIKDSYSDEVSSFVGEYMNLEDGDRFLLFKGL